MLKLDFFFMAQGCGFFLKGGKNNHEAYLQVIFLEIVNSVKAFTR